jgi:hypothetical protein
MPGSDDSEARSHGKDLVHPTLEGQLVDVASNAIQKICQKAAVAQGSWMRLFAPVTSEAAEIYTEKVEASAVGREKPQGLHQQPSSHVRVEFGGAGFLCCSRLGLEKSRLFTNLTRRLVKVVS